MRELQNARRVLWGWKLDVFYPSSTGELTSLCAMLDPARYRAAIVIGGDGTVHHAVQGLSGTGMALLPFPGGTANDLSQELGIPRSWEAIQAMLDREQTERIDLIEVNGERLFSTVAGIGIGASITAEFNRRRSGSAMFRWISRHLHSQAYSLLSAKAILTQRRLAQDVRIRADLFDEKLSVGAMFICNQSKLGRDLNVAPPLENNDRRFNVLILPQTSRLPLIRSLVELRSGTLSNRFIYFSTSRLRITSRKGTPLSVFGDGETLLEAPELDFRVLHQALTTYSGREPRRVPRNVRGIQ